MTLSDTQLALLSASSQRDDGLLPITDRLKGGAAIKVGEKLVALGLASETPIARGEPIWRSEPDGSQLGLKITNAGLAAIGIEPDTAGREAAAPAVPAGTPASAGKSAIVLQLLGREVGASIDDLTTATGWLPHSTRAALTGLRKKGHQIERARVDGKTVYRLLPVAEVAS